MRQTGLILIVSFLQSIAVHANTTRAGVESFHLSVLLVASPYPGHVIPFLALGEELVGRGHKVTLVSAPTTFIQKETEQLNIALWSIGDEILLNEKEMSERSHGGIFRMMKALFDMTYDLQERVLKTIDDQSVQLHDVMVVDAILSPFSLCFSRKWAIPTVTLWTTLFVSPFDMHSWTYPLPFSAYTDNLSFFQRFVSTVLPSLGRPLLKLGIQYFRFFEQICANASTPFNQIPYISDHVPQIVASSIGFEFSRTRHPLTEYVGPIHSKSPSPLPQDIAEWLDQREPRSVVYVSMGSTAILTAGEADSIVNGALEANFSVIWSLRKSNQDILGSFVYDSKRVLVVDWVPQLALLRHSSIYSAVLHGGLGGLQEALSFGVPVVAVPFFGDQFDSAARVQHHHYGKMIHRHQLSIALIAETLRLFASDFYRKSLQKIQRIYKKDGGASRAADLLEFYSEVGYEHLVPSYVKYNWSLMEFYNMDVCLVLVLTVFLMVKLICCCVHFFRYRSKSKEE